MILDISPSWIITIVILFLTIVICGNNYLSKGVCRIKKDLTNQIVVITGANTGIGKTTALALAKMNATVILACRDPKKSIIVADEIKKETGNKDVEFMQMDLSDLKSIKLFVENFKKKYQKLHILINNAGVILPDRKTTKDGFEMQFGTNHLGHFYLTTLLLDVIKSSAPSRIINLSSDGHYLCKKINWDDIMHEKNYATLSVYAQSKLANVIFSKELQRRLESSNVKVVSLHPGVVRTELTRSLGDKWYNKVILYLIMPYMKLIGKSPEEGAQTTLYCALEDQDKLKGGSYYCECKVRKENPVAKNQENWTKLWEVSEELIAKALQK